MQIENSDFEAKILLRKQALSLVDHPRVLDLYAGKGVMYEHVWKNADNYLGIDKRYCRANEEGLCWRGNNNNLLARAFMKEKWNIIDLDAFNDPWSLAKKTLFFLNCHDFIMTLTCGIKRTLSSGHASKEIRKITGTDGLSDTRLLIRWYDDIIQWIIHDWQHMRPFHLDSIKRIYPSNKKTVCYWLVKGSLE